MTQYFKVDDKQQLDFLKRIINNLYVKMHDNTGAYVEYLEIIDALKETFDNPQAAVDVNELFQAEKKTDLPVAQKAPTKKASKKSKSTRQPAVAKLPSICQDHPTFRALRSPRTDCKTCWDAYMTLNPNTAAIARRTFERKQRTSNDSA